MTDPAIPRIDFARWRSDVASGGNRYDDELAAGLRARGLDLREHLVTGPWPIPKEREREQFADMLGVEQDWLVDNIVGSAAPGAIASAVSASRRVSLLMHYFPSDDSSLSPRDRDRLAASEAAAVRCASTVVVTSEWAAREVSAGYGRDDAVVAEPGIRPADLAPGSLASGRPAKLLWLSRLTADKDPLTFIEALAQLRDLDWSAQLVGPDSVDESLTRRVHDRIVESGLDGRVEVVGPRHDDALETLWAGTDLLVHTSLAETYGMVISEALARGIPSIVATGTAAVEVQAGGATFPPGSSDALAAELRAWLTDPVRAQRWRAEAAERRVHLPTWEETARVLASTLTAAR